MSFSCSILCIAEPAQCSLTDADGPWPQIYDKKVVASETFVSVFKSSALKGPLKGWWTGMATACSAWSISLLRP